MSVQCTEFMNDLGERGGSVVECRTPEREVRGSRPTSAVLCPWARHFTPRKYWLITQEAMAPSRHDWKIVDWDVKPQHNQPTNIHKTCASLYRFKTKICFGCTFMYYMHVLSVPLLCNKGIVNIQVLCSIPLVWTWRYCQWHWQCLHIQTKGALITCINHCHLLELSLLCLVDLWKLDWSISNFKGAWCIYFYFISYRNACIYMQRVKILIIRRVLRRLI